MSTLPSVAAIIELFSTSPGWEDKYRQLMKLGKQLPRLDEDKKDEEALLAGCESQVWFYHDYDPQSGLIHWQIDSDARIIKGLISLLLSAYDGKTPQQIIEFDGEAYFKQLQLLQHLSPSRGNGIRAILNEIQRCAQAYS